MSQFDEAYLERTLQVAFESPEHYKLPKGITRYDYGSTHAWWTRVDREGAKFKQLFYDGQVGSIENGLRLALLYRHEVLSTFPDVAPKKFNTRSIPSEPERRIKRVIERGHLNPYIAWAATWHDAEYRRRERNFSVRKFGEDGAKLLALEAATKLHTPVQREHFARDPFLDERWRVVLRADVDADAARNEYKYRHSAEWDDALQTSPFGYEGGRRARLHMDIERDRNFRAKKIVAFQKQHGRLFCQLCSMNFLDRYPFLTQDIIEVHHLVPLHSLGSVTQIGLDDLMLLCSNCHTAIHQGDAVSNLEVARAYFGRSASDVHDA